MEAKNYLIEPLISKVEAYSKTSFELFKLKSQDTVARFASTLISRLIIWMVVFLFMLILSFAISMYLGELFGKIYFGFLAVAGFYLLVGILVYFLQNAIQRRLNIEILSQIIS